MKKRTTNVLKWIGIALITLSVLYTGLLLTSNRALRSAYAALESDGRPMTPEQVIPAEIPDADNAALVYETVVLLLKAERAGEEDLFAGLSAAAKAVLAEKTSAESMAHLRALVQNPATLKALAALQEGNAKPGCRYDLDYFSGPGLVCRHVGDLLQLSRILSVLARMQAEEGDDAAAWDTAIASLRLANALQGEPLVISQLVRIAQLGQACDTIQYLASVSSPPSRQIAELNRVLADFESMAPLVSAIDGERVLFGEWTFHLPREVLRSMEVQAQGIPSRFGQAMAKGVASSPLLKRDHAAYLTFMHGYAQTATASYSARDVALEKEQILNLPRYCTLTRRMVPAFSNLKTRALTMIAQVRVTRTGLALLKERQEKGVYPENLSGLDLDIPLDPFTGKPLVCQMTSSGFVVYSIGENLIDDKGTKSMERHSGDIVWRYSE